MAYKYTYFDNVALPPYNRASDLSLEVENPLIAVLGGGFDAAGGVRRLPRVHPIQVKGIYANDTEFIVDESGNFLVDESGNFVIAGDGPTQMRAALDALTAKLGVMGTLYRERMSDGVLQTKSARLISISAPRTTEQRDSITQVGLQFSSIQPAWRSQSQTIYSTTIGAGSTIAIENGGNVDIYDAVLTIVPTGALSSLRIQCAESGIDLTYLVADAGSVVRIDSGAQSVTTDGYATYASLVLNSGHSARGWLPVMVGAQVWTITSNTSATFSLSYYDQWL